MPLLSGRGSFKKNMKELMESPIRSSSRQKAINTISKKYGITAEQARAKQAVAISKAKFSER